MKSKRKSGVSQTAAEVQSTKSHKYRGEREAGRPGRDEQEADRQTADSRQHAADRQIGRHADRQAGRQTADSDRQQQIRQSSRSNNRQQIPRQMQAN
ncbi:hypothetical protein Tco_1158867 [Tanacetum coccineum]